LERLILKGGRVLDPATGRDGIADVLIEYGRVAAIDADLNVDDAVVVDASGQWVTPAFVDIHTHLREPGQEYKEDIASGGRSAVAGGFGTVACMANTEPVNDDPSVTDFILDRARQDSPARVHPIAAATKGLRGEVMTEMVALVEAGAVAFSDDGKTIMDTGVARRVMEYSTLVQVPVIVHAEDRTLVGDGVVNEGAVSTRLGLPGNPALAEAVHVSRDIQLAELTGAHVHIAHVSTGAAVQMVRAARDRGIRVTAEVTPHHLALTDEATLGYDTNAKMAPPLRGRADMEACRAGLADGTIDCIATDHAPHAMHEKDVDFCEAPNGIIGFETALAVVLDLIRTGEMEPLELVRRLTEAPARIIGRPCGTLAVGALADVTVFDPDRRWVYDPSKGFSKSQNSPWTGQELTGRVTCTLVDGRIVYDLERGVLVP
jgi:dihydroorotase